MTESRNKNKKLQNALDPSSSYCRKHLFNLLVASVPHCNYRYISLLISVIKLSLFIIIVTKMDLEVGITPPQLHHTDVSRRTYSIITKILAIFVCVLLSTLYIVYVLVFSGLNRDEYAPLLFIYTVLLIHICYRINLYTKLIYRYVIANILDIFQETKYRDILNGFVLITILAFLVYQCIENTKRVYAFGSTIALLLISFVINWSQRTRINWNIIIRSFNLHYILAIILFKFAFGRQCIIYLGYGIVNYFKFSESGSRFVYGDLLIDQYIFAFYVLSSLYLSFITITILHHVGFLNFMKSVSRKFSFLVGITQTEGVFGIFNSFLSMQEACIIVREQLTKLTKSEIFSLMVTGLSTISFNALFGYVNLGANVDYLIISSIISIPCSFILSKFFEPAEKAQRHFYTGEIINSPSSNETENSINDDGGDNSNNNDDQNLIDKCLLSIDDAHVIIQVIIGNLIGIMSFVAFIDKFVQILLSPFVNDMSLMKILALALSYILPILGVHSKDSYIVADMFVHKILINEFVGFQILGKNIDNFSSERSVAIGNLLICGFGNISSTAMLSSVIKSLTNSKVNTSKIMFKALIVSCFVNIFCACTISLMI